LRPDAGDHFESDDESAEVPSSDGSDEPIAGSEAASTRSHAPEQLLEGDDPYAVLRRIHDGDPLGLYEACTEVLGKGAYLIERIRLFTRAAARVAFAACYYGNRRADPVWVRRRVDEAVSDLMHEDECAVRGAPLLESDFTPPTDLVPELGNVPQPEALAACVAFNGLPHRVRRAYQGVVLEGRPAAQQALRMGESEEQVMASVGHAMLALLDPRDERGKRGRSDG
jgi:hypothetical protein